MDINRILEIKNSSCITRVFYKNHEVWINSVDCENNIAQILDLQTYETYVVNCKKLLEGVCLDNSNLVVSPFVDFV